MLPRRRFLEAGVRALGLLAPPLAASTMTARLAAAAPDLAPRTPPDFTVHDVVVGDARARALAGRFTLFVPNHLGQLGKLGKDERSGLLVLLHGLGETGDRETGVYAWVERYGLGTAYARLRRPPIARTSSRPDLLPAARLAALNATLATRPFHGMTIACPYTPNLGPLAEADLARYANWIADAVLPEARRIAPLWPDAGRVALDGVSLGGYLALEVFCRRPEAFGAWGAVQGAFGAARAASYADRLASAVQRAVQRSQRPVRLHIETTDGDVFREGSTLLGARLNDAGVACELSVLPGQHDQVFLREAGTLEMLLWHDRGLS